MFKKQLMVAMLASCTWAQISIQGRMIEQGSNTPLSGVNVKLGAAQLAMTTGADGAFILYSATAVLFTHAQMQFDGNQIQLNLSQPQKVQLSILDTKGSSLYQFESPMSTGNQQIALSTKISNLSIGKYFIRLQVGGEVQNFSFEKSSQLTLSHLTEHQALGEVDTLIASKAGYNTQRYPMSTYVGHVGDLALSKSAASANVAEVLTEAQLFQIFPILNPAKRATYSACHQKHLPNATYASFVKAVAKFPGFLAEGSVEDRKRELAAFFANVSKETTGGWATAPGGYEAWGLCFVEETGYVNGGIGYTTSNDPMYQAVGGQSYHGRGPIQISYPYNYGPFSEALYGDKSILLNMPGKVLTDGEAFWASAIWFWMNEAVSPGMPKPGGIAPVGQYYKPSCHMVMTNTWTPRASDISYKRTEGLGTTINVINGGLECGGGWDARGQGRVKNYKAYTAILGVTALPAGKTEADWMTCQQQMNFSTP